MPSDETIRRILAGEPTGSGAGQSPARTQAVAPLLAGFPRATQATANPLVGLATLTSEAEQDENTLSFRVDHRFSNSQSFYVRYLFSDGEVDTPDRTVTPRRVRAKQRPQNLVFNYQSVIGTNLVNEFKVGYNGPQTSANAFSNQANYDPVGVSLSGTFTSSSIDARGNTGIARSGLLIRATSASTTTGSNFDPRSISLNNATTWTRGRAHAEGRLRVPDDPVGLPVPGQHRNHLQQRQRFHRQPPGRGGGGARFAGVQAAAVLRGRLRRRTRGASATG